MKSRFVLTAAVVCALAAFLSCNVGVTVGQDGGQAEPAKDSGGRPESDGGGGSDGGLCPPGSHEPTCHSDTDCPADYVCKYFNPGRPECGGDCEFVDVLTDGGVPDAGPLPCAELDYCGCADRADCEVLSNGCLCGCDYQCPGDPPCVCDCGGGEYLGCKEKNDPNPCGPGGFCRNAVMSSCGDPDFEAAPGLSCKYGDGGTGYCCIPIKTCSENNDCPGCEMCEMTRIGPRTCKEPISGGQRCTGDADCSQYYRCATPLMTDKPECGGICVYDNVPDAGRPDADETCVTTCDCPYELFCEAGVCVPPGGGVGQVSCCDRPCPSGMPCQHADGRYGTCPGDADVGRPDAGSCVGEGESINKTGDPNPPQCCFGLDELPLMAADPTGGCAAPGCDCVVCTTPCGNGRCSAGKNVCNCEQDCGEQPAGGPGSECASDIDCKGGATCLTEKSGYPTGGYCAGPVCDLFGGPGQCPAGSICLPMDFAQAPGLCMDACGADHDCRSGLTCEAMPVSARYFGTPYFCWQSGAGGLAKGLGESCKDGTDCITRMCEALGAGSVKVCTQYCYSEQPCKDEQICAPNPNCGAPDCGTCFYPVR
jgi:hypothetical protein